MPNAFVLSVQVSGEQQVLQALSAVEGAMKDMRPAFVGIASEWQQSVEQTFAAAGPGWKPLSPAYAAWKAKHYPGKGLLVRSGLMRGAATGKKAIIEIAPDHLTLGVPQGVPYAIYQQQGTKRMPARPFIKVTPEQQTRWGQAILKRIIQAGKEAGL